MDYPGHALHEISRRLLWTVMQQLQMRFFQDGRMDVSNAFDLRSTCTDTHTHCLSHLKRSVSREDRKENFYRSDIDTVLEEEAVCQNEDLRTPSTESKC
jgi:hypothetical protein